jgi:hypothetical protein
MCRRVEPGLSIGSERHSNPLFVGNRTTKQMEDTLMRYKEQSRHFASQSMGQQGDVHVVATGIIRAGFGVGPNRHISHLIVWRY